MPGSSSPHVILRDSSQRENCFQLHIQKKTEKRGSFLNFSLENEEIVLFSVFPYTSTTGNFVYDKSVMLNALKLFHIIHVWYVLHTTKT